MKSSATAAELKLDITV